MSFYEWLLSHHGERDTRLGHLAKVVQADAAFPRTTEARDGQGGIVRHLRSLNANEDVLDDFTHAWADYAASWLRCPLCLVGYAPGFGGREAGERCRNRATGQERPCVGRLIPQEEFAEAEWVFPREYEDPDPRDSIRVA